jgi:hypothetical protein
MLRVDTLADPGAAPADPCALLTTLCGCVGLFVLFVLLLGGKLS